MIDEKVINEIIDKTDIVSLVGEYVKLTKRGKNYFGLCPFHDDSNPSFSVSPEKKIAKCMTCGEGGNPINFLRKIKNISFNEACSELANRIGMKLDIAKTDKKIDHNLKYYEINQNAKEFYEHFLFHSQSGKEALDYLHKRGLSDETIKMFGIGLAPKERTTVFKLLRDKGFSDLDIADVGLAKNGRDGYYDMFTNRIMFPIIDEENHVIGFSGRIYYPDSTEPKYVNTTETPVYHKGEKLFNLNNAIVYARKKKRLILCEGQMDAISIYNAGLKEVVASLGTALTINQVHLIKRFTEQIIIMYDGDNAGINAIGKAFNLFKGFDAKAVVLPNGMDPDEYIKQYGNKALEEYIEANLLDYYEFNYFNVFRNRNLSNAYDYEEVKKGVFNALSETQSYALIEKYLKRLSNDLKVSYDAIYSDYNLYSTHRSIPKDVEIIPEEKNPSTKLAPYERMFIVLSIIDKKHFDFFNDELSGGVEKYLLSAEAISLYVALNYFFNAGNRDSLMLLRYLKQETGLAVVNDFYKDITVISNYDDEQIEKIKNDCVKRFKRVLFQEKRKSFIVNTNDASEETLKTMTSKLEFVRSNIKMGK